MIVTVACWVASCVLVAVTRNDDPLAGAVTKPSAVMVPAVVDHVTAEVVAPVPVAIAVQVIDLL